MTHTRFIAPLAIAGLVLGTILTLPASAATATPDTDKPIHVSADTLTVDDKAGTATYTGTVHVTQGGLTLDADRVDLYRDSQGDLSRIKATGSKKRAFIQQQPTATDPLMRGWGNVINYYVGQHKVDMVGNSELHRGTDTFNGPYVEYFLDSRRVNANTRGSGSNGAGGPQKTTNGRVNMTLTPSHQNQK